MKALKEANDEKVLDWNFERKVGRKVWSRANSEDRLVRTDRQQVMVQHKDDD